jgi:hypothetical protein
MKKAVLIMLALVSSLVSAQNLQNANWLFGEYAGLNFNPSPPPGPLLPSTSTGMDAHEGCATISAPDGTLLFYTDSNKVWNKNHQVMPNGTGLVGSAEGSQNAVIIPRPGDNTRFFVVTLDGYMGTQKGLYYSEVDMTLNSGLGDVISATKNTVLNDHTGTPLDGGYNGVGNLSHRITYYPHSNGHDYWLVTQIDKWVFSHLVTDTGIVLNAAQASAAPWIANYGPAATGQMKISPNGTRIAMAYTKDATGMGAVFLGDFVPATGQVVMNPVMINTLWGDYWGLEFSPNSQILYYTREAEVYAYEIGSRKTVQVGTFTDPDVSMQLAIDGRIYVATREIDKISHIKFPDVFGTGCTYEYAVVPLNGRLSHRGLPGWVYWQNQKLWPRTFSSTFIRAEPRDILTDTNDNVYYMGTMHNYSEPINVRSHEDPNFIVPYWNEHTLPGFNPANYSQPQYSDSQLFKFDKYGNMVWHKPLPFFFKDAHMRKTVSHIFIYKDAANSGDTFTKEVIDYNNNTIVGPVTHTWGYYNGLDQNGYEMYIKNVSSNNFLITLVNPLTNAITGTLSVNLSGTILSGSLGLNVAYCASNDYIFVGTTGAMGTTKVAHVKRSGSTHTYVTILFSYANAAYTKFQHLFFNNRLFLGYFNRDIYVTFDGPSSPVNATIKIFNYGGGTFTGTGTTITFPGDYVYTMTAGNNKVLYVGHKRLYEGFASGGFAPTGVITFPGETAGKVANYDATGNIIVAGKYWKQNVLTLPGSTQNLLAYGGGYTYPSNPYTYTTAGAGHHFITKFKTVTGGYDFYRPVVTVANEGTELSTGTKIMLYPNPVIRELTIEIAAGYTQFEVYGIEGKLMASGPISSKEPLKLDVSGYAGGTYFIKMFNDKGEAETKQFLKL